MIRRGLLAELGNLDKFLTCTRLALEISRVKILHTIF